MIRVYRDSLSTLEKTHKNKCCISYDLDLSRKCSRTISRVVFDITIRFVTITQWALLAKAGGHKLFWDKHVFFVSIIATHKSNERLDAKKK